MPENLRITRIYQSKSKNYLVQLKTLGKLKNDNILFVILSKGL